ncbi:hypothetical protein KIN20_032956 [Parelaphostrongylus tenuis]|uniref:Uncharacterized protein n=1 Tax=Parelaphostrongylus tenuis TaxID=148309 RepID=A0AAD5R7I4_PARTN|nr:hypothetical protein KIN20_032956 [Parelaphostrongylus tenuis]
MDVIMSQWTKAQWRRIFEGVQQYMSESRFSKDFSKVSVRVQKTSGRWRALEYFSGKLMKNGEYDES